MIYREANNTNDLNLGYSLLLYFVIISDLFIDRIIGMSELIDIFDSTMNLIEKGVKRECCNDLYLESINGYTCIVLAFIKCNDSFLLDKRAKGKIASGLWELPGGGVKSNESFDHAIQRELSEELGIHMLYESKKIYTLGNTFYHCYFYNLDSQDLQFNLDDNEVESVQWVTYDQFNGLCNANVVVNSLLIQQCFNDSHVDSK